MLTTRTAISCLRIVTSFALLGVVVAGSFLGWVDQAVVDVRAIGGIVGASAAVVGLACGAI